MSLSGGLTAGLVAGLTSRAMGRVSAAWNPSRLTGLAATLLPAESRSRGLLWQNTAKTDPATADGHPVRVAVCPFTAVEFTAPSDAARPLLWDEGSGKWSLSFDGVDDQLTATLSAFNWALLGLRARVGTVPFSANVGAVTPVSSSDPPYLVGTSGASAWDTGGFPSPYPTAWFRNGTSTAAVTGAAYATYRAQRASTTSVPGAIRVGADRGLGRFLVCRVAGLLMSADTTDAGRTDQDTYLGAL